MGSAAMEVFLCEDELLMRQHFCLRMLFEGDPHYKLTHTQYIVAEIQHEAAAALPCLVSI
jgi:hypothetical protein